MVNHLDIVCEKLSNPHDCGNSCSVYANAFTQCAELCETLHTWVAHYSVILCSFCINLYARTFHNGDLQCNFFYIKLFNFIKLCPNYLN